MLVEIPAHISAGGRVRSTSTLRLLAGEVAEALLPPRCLVCGRFGAALHDRCVAELLRAAPPRCPVCWAPGAAAGSRRYERSEGCDRCAHSPAPFAALRMPFRFVGAARRALLEAKFRGMTGLLEPMATAAATVVPASWAVDAVVAVPLHPGRQRRRGYNQAEVAARAVAAELDAPLERSLLWRVRATPPQVGLDARARGRNLRGAFAVAGWSPSRVLLVDDVTTTGATFETAAAALRRAGAEAVYALALARED